MAFLSLLMRRQLPQAASYLARAVRLGRAPQRRLHGSARQRLVEKGPWGKSRGPEPPQHYQLSDLDRADALVSPVPEEVQSVYLIFGVTSVCLF